MGFLLLAAAWSLLSSADSMTELTAIIGGTLLVLAASLLALTVLAWRWSGGDAAYTATVVDATGLYEELAATVAADDAVSAAS